MNSNTFADLGGVGLLCPDSTPTFLGLLDPSIAPPFLYYSYLPVIIVALLFGAFIFIVSRGPAGRSLLGLAILFSLITAGELFLWIAASASLVHFVWQIIIIFHALLAFLLVHFTYVFVREEDMPPRWQWTLLLPLLPVFILAPTTMNLSAFDLVNCEGIQGILRPYMYVVEIAALAVAFFLCAQRGRRAGTRQEYRKVVTLGIGIVLFFGLYILANAFGDATLIYDINFIGPMGMVAFLGIITYLIVRYHAFNMRVLGAQALVVAVFAFLAAALFVQTIESARYVLIATLVLVTILGVFLVRGVRREVDQREHIEKLAGELEDTNERQEGLTHFIGHEVKGFLTKDAGAFASLLDGDYAPLPAALKPFVETALVESRQGADSVASILKASNLKKGTVTYEKAPFDLKELVASAVEKERALAEHRGLMLSFTAEEGSYQMNGDGPQINDHVLRNLIDNAINYTPTGSVQVTLSRGASSLIFSVKDTGVGITDEDKKRLFTEGGHGKDSQTINAHSTGYGLYIAKRITEAHGGTIRVESEGAGKGSTFIVEFPIG